MQLTLLTLHCLVSQQLCKTAILIHRHKTLFYQAFSHKMCIRWKTIRVWMSNFMLLRTRWKICSHRWKILFKCLICKISVICMEAIEINYIMIDRLGAAFIPVLGWKDAVIECLVYNLDSCVWWDSGCKLQMKEDYKWKRKLGIKYVISLLHIYFIWNLLP